MWLMKLFRRRKPFKIQEPVSRSTGTTGPPGVPQDGYETCVLCGRVTPVPVEMPVDARKHFVVGCGQLCETCYWQIERAAD